MPFLNTGAVQWHIHNFLLLMKKHIRFLMGLVCHASAADTLAVI